MRSLYLLFIAVFCALVSCSDTNDEVVIGYVEGLSGPFANIGEVALRHLELEVEAVNRSGNLPGSVRMRILPFDNKTNPQEALLAFRAALDAGVDYVFQGNSSSVATALTDAIAKHNRRNPSNPVIFMNYAALDPALTNEHCEQSHFRFDADVNMKMAALTEYIAVREDIESVYLINQDYSYGQAVATSARSMLKQKRPDLRIAGDDLHPIGRIKDFSPYVAKIKSSGAQAIVTGNWGSDLTLLIKSARQMGVDIDFFTFNVGMTGGVSTIGEAGIERVYQITNWHANINEQTKNNANLYRSRYPDVFEDAYYGSVRRAVRMLEKAMIESDSTSPADVGRALKNMSLTDDTGLVSMREDNHQLLQPLFVSKLVRISAENGLIGVEDVGLGFETVAEIYAEKTRMPTTCQFE
ncbi:branched-chain amino acid ABC transporter substrate-binding protein [Burkholderiales bacterium]|nr:branched-chain amino acid ABC transporter substrate-binding protein [Burkholderiales bacterium]